MTINNFHVSNDIRNKLKLDTSTSFYKVQNWDTVPNKKFDRVLYYFEENDNEEIVMKNLKNISSPGALILVCGIPQINKRLSNGELKENKDVLPTVLNENGIERFWFLSAERDHLFDLLAEVK